MGKKTDLAGSEDSISETRFHDTDETRVTIGVGDGSGNLFVHGSFNAVKRVQGFILDSEELRRSKPFSQLTPQEVERLACVAEEAAEVGQVVGKILRHGFHSHHPDFPMTTNRELLEKELGDLLAVQEMLIRSGDLDVLAIRKHADQKHRNLPNWLHHN